MRIPILSTHLEKRRMQKAEKAFQEVVAEIAGQNSVRLSGAASILQRTRMPDKLRVLVYQGGFTSSPIVWGASMLELRHKGAVIATTVLPEVRARTDRLTVAFTPSMFTGEKTSEFRQVPGEKGKLFIGPDFRFNFADELDAQRRLSSFSHVVLLFKKGKPILFVPVFQKVIETSKKTKRSVDRFVGVHGPDRHLFHLSLVEKIAEVMQQRGVKTEVHIPAPRHLLFQHETPEETRNRVKAPFEKLESNFHGDSLELSGMKINTINLSRPKKHRLKLA
ncbi:MAG: hypothetical protein Q8R15_02075 [Candidatus Micrarchaeota archaeon]|nr:hypothetical protein [Candidatus Micrarchaeota archaeon]